MAEDTTIRDRLAHTRTVLANERTLLAYLRTAMAFLIAGASAVHFLDSRPAEVLGWVAVGVGVITLVVGLWRFRRIQGELRRAPQAVRVTPR